MDMINNTSIQSRKDTTIDRKYYMGEWRQDWKAPMSWLC